MKKRFVSSWFVGLLALGLPFASADSPEAVRTVQPNNAFGYALMGTVADVQLAKNANANIFISPVSAAVALQMLLNGAGPGSTTYLEVAKTLGVDGLNLEAINQANHTLLERLQSPPPPPVRRDGKVEAIPMTLTIANSAWANHNRENHFEFAPGFTSRLGADFRAQALSADFATKEGLDAINGWASKNTNGKIKEVVTARVLKPLSFVLMNATYFKANWQNPFSARSTSLDQAFFRADGTESKVEMMSSGREYGYAETASAQTMELPYAGGNASMIIVLPKQGIKLSALLKDADGPLTAAFWQKLAQTPRKMARFAMPKFGFSYDVDLKDILRTMGIQTVFTNAADLSAIGSPPTRVDLVKQSTFVKVDETGTEAAAVTVIGGVPRSAPRPPVDSMRVDRPFLVSIVEKTTGSVLFMGVISNPLAQ